MQNEQYREMMTVGNVDQLMALFGPHDENVDLVRRETGAEIFAHGDEITLSGEEEAVRLAHLVLDKLLAILAQGEGIDRSRIRYEARSNSRSGSTSGSSVHPLRHRPGARGQRRPH